MAGVFGPHMSNYFDLSRNEFQLLADLFPDFHQFCPAGADFLFFADIMMNDFFSGKGIGKRLTLATLFARIAVDLLAFSFFVPWLISGYLGFVEQAGF